jgi:hypothetical protein
MGSPLGYLPGLASADWFTVDRARAYGRVVSAGMLVFILAVFGLFVHSAWTDPHGLSFSCDFNAFWSGARFAVLGHAASAYVPSLLKAMEEANAQPAPGGGFIAYPYPPVFMLLCLPFGFLPYLVALPIFVGGTSAAFAAAIKRVLPTAWPLLAIIASPAVMVNAASTQNGCLSASLFTGAMITLERRPAVAGALLGLLTFKPHLALCVPVSLLCAHRWRALVACVLSAIGLCVFSLAVLGTSAWQGFFTSLAFTRAMMQTRPIWGTGQSVYAAARILQIGTPAGLTAQAVATAFALVCVVRTARARPGGGPEMAVVIAAALLCTPYVMDYDLVCLGAPMAWLAATAAGTAWRPAEKWVLSGLYLYPLFARTFSLMQLPLAPLLVAALLIMLVRRLPVASTSTTKTWL